MSRTAWSLPIIALLTLPLVSCFDDVGDCPTCPPASSGSILISVDEHGLVDSVYVSVDGGARVTLKRKGQVHFTGLSIGTHVVQTRRWFKDESEIAVPRDQTIDIQLERGETRTIVFHNDFPLVTWRDDALGGRARLPHAPRWASA